MTARQEELLLKLSTYLAYSQDELEDFAMQMIGAEEDDFFLFQKAVNSQDWESALEIARHYDPRESSIVPIVLESLSLVSPS
jgi:hypothetical protein